MDTPTSITAHGPEDILSFIPHSLGYWPTSSLVAVTLHNKGIGATLRLDLPAPHLLRDPTPLVRAVCGYLQADGEADETLVVIFSGTGERPAAAAHDLLLVTLQMALTAAGMPIRDAWYVGTKYWRDAYCSNLECCPLPGRPVQEILDSRLNAEMVFRGSTFGPEPVGVPVGLEPADKPYALAVRRARSQWSRKLERRQGCEAQFSYVLSYWALVLAQPAGLPWRQDVERDAFLLATLRMPVLRDAVLVLSAAGQTFATESAARFRSFTLGRHPSPVLPECGQLLEVAAAPPPEAWVSGKDDGAVPGYGEVLMGLWPAVPTWSRMDALDRVAAHLSSVGGKVVSAPLTVRGWIAWSRGRGSMAAAFFGQALWAEPQYRLAELLLEMDRRGTICGWAARREAAWQHVVDGTV